MHDAITLGVPVLVILFGILFNRQGLSELKADNMRGLSEIKAENKQGLNELKADLKAEMRAMESRLEGRITSLERDMKDFYRIQAEHDAKIDALREKS